jgi:hypothetical protein
MSDLAFVAMLMRTFGKRWQSFVSAFDPLRRGPGRSKPPVRNPHPPPGR